MGSDRPKKKGRGFASTARASAISRFMKKNFGVLVNNSASRGHYGVYVHQAPYAVEVEITVSTPIEEDACSWAGEITQKLTDAGYEVQQGGSGTRLYVTKAEWRFADKVTTDLFGISPAIMESDSGLVAALPVHVARLRKNGWIKPDTLELTEKGHTVRAHLLVEKKKREQAEKRRLRERGW